MSASRQGFGKPGVWVDAGAPGGKERGTGEGGRELKFGMAKGEAWIVAAVT